MDRSPGAVARVWLALVAALFFAAQVWLVSGVPLGWDESIYASQTDPRRPALGFSAPRARGMSWVAAPVQALTGSPIALRVSLAALSSLLLHASYAVWLRVRPDASVPIAALGLASLWVTVFYGPSLMPNVVVALAGVLATGTFLAHALGRGPRWYPWAGALAVAAATMVRPGDVAPLVMALGAVVVLWRPWRRRAVALLAPVVLGSAAGALPWLVEAHLRYGGILARVRRAISTQGTGERFTPDYHLRSVDGPLLCRPCSRESQPIPPYAVLLWAGGALLVALAVWLVLRGADDAAKAAAIVPAAVGTTLAAPYLLFVGYGAPRFLLPAYALLVIPAAQALWHLRGRMQARFRPVAAAVVVVAFIGHLTVQAAWLERISSGSARARQSWVLVANALAQAGVVPPCTLTGPPSAPVAHVARCDAVQPWRYPGDEPFTHADLDARARRERVALVVRTGQEVPSHAREWARLPASELPRGWQVWLAPTTRGGS